MGQFCCKEQRLSAQTRAQINAKLKEASELLRNSKLTCLLDRNGVPLFSTISDAAKQDEMSLIVSSMKRAALHFADTLDQAQCSVIHVRGQKHMFSCYDVGDSLLALYSEMESHEIDSIDTTEIDDLMNPLLAELRMLLDTAYLNNAMPV